MNKKLKEYKKSSWFKKTNKKLYNEGKKRIINKTPINKGKLKKKLITY